MLLVKEKKPCELITQLSRVFQSGVAKDSSSGHLDSDRSDDDLLRDVGGLQDAPASGDEELLDTPPADIAPSGVVASVPTPAATVPMDTTVTVSSRACGCFPDCLGECFAARAVRLQEREKELKAQRVRMERREEQALDMMKDVKDLIGTLAQIVAQALPAASGAFGCPALPDSPSSDGRQAAKPQRTHKQRSPYSRGQERRAKDKLSAPASDISDDVASTQGKSATLTPRQHRREQYFLQRILPARQKRREEWRAAAVKASRDTLVSRSVSNTPASACAAKKAGLTGSALRDTQGSRRVGSSVDPSQTAHCQGRQERSHATPAARSPSRPARRKGQREAPRRYTPPPVKTTKREKKRATSLAATVSVPPERSEEEQMDVSRASASKGESDLPYGVVDVRNKQHHKIAKPQRSYAGAAASQSGYEVVKRKGKKTFCLLCDRPLSGKGAVMLRSS